MNKDKLEEIFNNDLGTSYFPLLAEAYLKDNDYERALKVLDIGLLLNPNNNDGKYIKAKIAMINGDSKMAVELLKAIIDSNPLYINAMKMLVMYYHTTETNQAFMMRIIKNIIDLAPKDEFANKILKSSQKKAKYKPTTKKIAPKTPKSVTRKAAPKKAKQTSKPKKAKLIKKETAINLEIDPKMATLTFIDILIKQKQYMQAGNVLKIVKKNKSIARASIDQRSDRIKRGLSKES